MRIKGANGGIAMVVVPALIVGDPSSPPVFAGGLGIDIDMDSTNVYLCRRYLGREDSMTKDKSDGWRFDLLPRKAPRLHSLEFPQSREAMAPSA